MGLPEIRHFYVFRHGETDWNAQERFQGHLNIPLNDKGREQARALVPVLKQEGVEAVLSSDLSRAHETGWIIAQALGIPQHKHVGIREAHLGEAQGLTRHEIEARFGEELARRWRSWHVTDADVFYPGGETGTQIMERVFGTLEEFVAGFEYERIGIATHGGVIRRMMQRILPPGSEPVPIPNGVLYHVTLHPASGRWEFQRPIRY